MIFNLNYVTYVSHDMYIGSGNFNFKNVFLPFVHFIAPLHFRTDKSLFNNDLYVDASVFFFLQVYADSNHLTILDNFALFVCLFEFFWSYSQCNL